MMAAEPLPDSEAKPVDVKAARNVALFMGTVAAVQWFMLGPDNPLVALMVVFCTSNLGIAVIPLALRIPPRWYHVPRAERWLHLALGVPLFGWLLDVSGWNRHVALPMRQLKINRANIAVLLTYVHAAEGAHAIAFVPHVVLALIAEAGGHSVGALWILLPGVVMHLYPVLLQRWMTLRVEPLVERCSGQG